MRKLAFFIASASLAFGLAAPAGPAAAQTRTWVSQNGLLINALRAPPCPAQFPCNTFATALSVTSAGGEINCLDDGSYGAANITQSVTIDCGGHTGAIDVSGSANGITINGSGIVVKLRNLTVAGNGGSGTGVLIQNAAAVVVEDCAIVDFSATPGRGIDIASSNSLQLNVSNTLIANNNVEAVRIIPPGAGIVNFVADHVRMENNPLFGVVIQGVNSSGVITGFLRESVISGSSEGVFVVTNVGTAATTLSIYGTHVVGNSLGIECDGNGAVILSNSTIQANGTALFTANGGTIFSYDNNDINDNGSAGPAPNVIAQH